jgi:hypothetical protein
MGGCMAASGFGIHFGEGESMQISVSRMARNLDVRRALDKKGRDHSRPHFCHRTSAL